MDKSPDVHKSERLSMLGSAISTLSIFMAVFVNYCHILLFIVDVEEECPAICGQRKPNRGMLGCSIEL